MLGADEMEQLHRHGWCRMRLPQGLRSPFVAAWSAFFARESAYKNTFRTPSLRGTYMTPHPGLHEAFEYKQSSNVDPSFRCPAECASSTRAMFEWCEGAALRVLRQLLEHVAARGDQRGAAWRWKTTDYEPDSTLRVLHYDRVTPAVRLEELTKAFPDHTDSSLVTIAPRSTMAALEMKRFDTGAWECVEEDMRDDDDECVVFMGDSGAYLTNNYFPSPLHRPGPARMCSHARPGTRISTPFFLRGAQHVALNPSLFAECSLPPLTVALLDSNVGLCRDRMPWKLTGPYYASMNYS